ncbi:hypothetical protein FGB62_72g026 [Gracilaria domingensis]|nr:hypothetical protein FGB62_72g026 [Gracilaria domingensis]
MTKKWHALADSSPIVMQRLRCLKLLTNDAPQFMPCLRVLDTKVDALLKSSQTNNALVEKLRRNSEMSIGSVQENIDGLNSKLSMIQERPCVQHSCHDLVVLWKQAFFYVVEEFECFTLVTMQLVGLIWRRILHFRGRTPVSDTGLFVSSSQHSGQIRRHLPEQGRVRLAFWKPSARGGGHGSPPKTSSRRNDGLLRLLRVVLRSAEDAGVDLRFFEMVLRTVGVLLTCAARKG